MDIKLSSPGMKALEAQLARKQATVGAELSRNLRRSLSAIEASAQAFAPVLTGELKAGIRSRAYGLSGEVVSEAPYSEYVEQGTSDTAPQPFMRPAVDRQLPRLSRNVLDTGADLW